MTNTHGGSRPNSGALSKAKKGERKYQRLLATVPPELYDWLILNMPIGRNQFSGFVTTLIERGREDWREEFEDTEPDNVIDYEVME